MASRDYCANVAEELEVWSEKLHDLSSKIDTIPSINKYKLYPQIEELHMIMTELDDRLCELTVSCPTADRPTTGAGDTAYPAAGPAKGGERFDYDYGG